MTRQEEINVISKTIKADEAGDIDTAICLGLTQGNGWWGNMLANGHYISPRGDLASDYHDYCHINSLDPNEVHNAEYFLKQFKLEQKMKKIEEDFQ